ncbi:MAG TPA: secretin N-terminal domain-containing protein [Thermodesulfovibrionia bacterium]|nr:secretin N-terminal domain-containing protein [Thermodesulfovibrionia bacterium]
MPGVLIAQAAPPPVATVPPAAPPGQPVQPSDTVSFYFDNIDIYELIHIIFRDVLDINYIIDPRVKGQISFRTTMSLKKEDILPIMEIILRLNGVGIVKEGDVYTIVPIQGIAKEPSAIQFGKDPKSVKPEGTAVVQIIPLDFISSTEMNKVLTPFITQGATIIDVPEQNFLIISDIDTNIKRMLDIIEIFDKKDYAEVAKPNIYVHLLKNSKADHVATILQELLLGGAGAKPQKDKTSLVKQAPKYKEPTKTGQPTQPPTPTISPAQKTSIDEEPLVAPGTKIFHDEISNAIIILATKTDYRLIEETIKKLDLTPRQVLIDVLIADIQLTGDLQFGVDWLIRGSFKDDSDRKHIALGLDTPTVDSGGITFRVTVENETRALIQTLVTEDKAELLAAPHILASDNNEAKIQIGSEEPIITRREDVSTEGTTNRPVQDVQYRDTGIVLTVKPQINAGGLIAMDLQTELSSVEFRSQLGNLPAFPKTETKTNLIVQDGDTIVIGGLIREDVTDNMTGIPYISRIPLLGALFRFKQDKKIKREVVVLLTPHVIKNREESDVVTADFIKKLKNLKRSLKYQEKSQGEQEENDM